MGRVVRPRRHGGARQRTGAPLPRHRRSPATQRRGGVDRSECGEAGNGSAPCIGRPHSCEFGREQRRRRSDVPIARAGVGALRKHQCATGPLPAEHVAVRVVFRHQSPVRRGRASRNPAWTAIPRTPRRCLSSLGGSRGLLALPPSPDGDGSGAGPAGLRRMVRVVPGA